jgi:itaconyl-CoA hydratase
VQTTGYNQDGKIVITFKRIIMVYKRGQAPKIPRLTPEKTSGVKPGA